MRITARFLPAAALLALLAACSTPPIRSIPSPPSVPATVTPVLPPTPVGIKPQKPKPPATLWARLRARFVMPGCDADPAITVWASRFTRHPRWFEDYLRKVAPTIAFIEKAARKAGVPAEFSLLPWVESRYRAMPPHWRGSAGMWQITHATARTLGLPVERDYDARLDRVASTGAVMKMLRDYYRHWHDWRLVDMAYNAGPYRILHLHPQGPAPAQPAIPDLAVSPITHNHLIKLLAIACVIRNPARFHVQLPKLPATDHLQNVRLPVPATLDAVAHAAGMRLSRVRRLNAAYLHGRMPGHGPWHVLLPSTAAKRLRLAMIAGRLPRQPATYTVAPGDTLWDIARHHGLSVSLLRRLNHLRGHVLHPGQVLFVEAPN